MWLGDKKPSLGRDVFVAPSAAVIGDVQLGNNASVFYGSVIRGERPWQLRVDAGGRRRLSGGSTLNALLVPQAKLWALAVLCPDWLTACLHAPAHLLLPQRTAAALALATAAMCRTGVSSAPLAHS